MKTKIFMAVLTLLLSANTSFAETIPEPSWSIGNQWPFYYPLDGNLFFNISYSCPLILKDGAVAYIYHHNNIVATCKLSAEI